MDNVLKALPAFQLINNNATFQKLRNVFAKHFTN